MGLFWKQLGSKTLLFRANGTDQGTYYLNGKAVCLQPICEKWFSGYEFCSQAAGMGTSHLGEGRCKFHSKASAEDIATMGRYEAVTEGELRSHYENFVTDPRLLDITPELALQRTLLAKAMQAFSDDPESIDSKYILGLIRDIVESVSKIEKIQSQQVLTAATARFMISKAIEVARAFIPEMLMPDFIMRWRNEVEAPALLTGQVINQ